MGAHSDNRTRFITAKPLSISYRHLVLRELLQQGGQVTLRQRSSLPSLLVQGGCTAKQLAVDRLSFSSAGHRWLG